MWESWGGYTTLQNADFLANTNGGIRNPFQYQRLNKAELKVTCMKQYNDGIHAQRHNGEELLHTVFQGPRLAKTLLSSHIAPNIDVQWAESGVGGFMVHACLHPIVQN